MATGAKRVHSERHVMSRKLIPKDAKAFQECYDLAMSVARSYRSERHSTAVMIATHILAAAKEAGHELMEKAAM